MKNSDGPDRMASIGNDFKNVTENISGSRSVSQCSKTLKQALQQYTSVQVWDWLFKSCQVNGRILFRDGLIDVKDIEECILKGRYKKLAIKLQVGLYGSLPVLICVLSDRLDPLPKPVRFIIPEWRRRRYLGSQVGLIQQLMKLCTRWS
nr:uncharacterized membrane protein At3g27390 isoform X1 [Tanacetum cinerariifolium]